MKNFMEACNRGIRSSLFPLFLLCACPSLAIVMWYVNTKLAGSLTLLIKEVLSLGVFGFLSKAWAPVFFGSTTAWTIIIVFMVVQMVIMKFMPGPKFLGPITPKGNVPVYKANGMLSYLTTMTLFCLGSFVFDWFPATILYDHLGEIIGAMNVFSLVLCAFLYLKGRYRPSSSDCGSSGNIIFDYYWGTELYPRIFGIDIKMFTNCRFGMTAWPLLLLSYAAKQHQLYGLTDAMLVSVALQLIYITKFFYWETGYLRSLDIMHDRAGFYICWGCLVWVPAIYTSPSMYLVQHPIHLGSLTALSLFAIGAIAIAVNYIADRQRQRVRATNGACKVWNKPARTVPARYMTTEGEKKETILLVSGFWGVARHFHYIPEIAAAFVWSVPALFFSPVPYFYVIFLTLLLTERAVRDDRRCSEKYGNDWDAYCKIVPYKMIPFVY